MSYSTQTGGFNVQTRPTNLQLVEASGMSSGGTAVLTKNVGDPATDFYLDMYNNAGLHLGARLDLRTLASHEALNQNDFRIMALSNGNVLVTYNKNDTSDSGVNDAYFFVVDQAGTKVVSDTQINTSTGSSLTRGLDLIELANGNIAFSYQLADNASYGTRVFKPDGSVVGAEAFVASTNGALTAIAANTDGSYMVTYSYTQGGIAKIDFKTYSSQGIEQNAGNLYTDPATANVPQWEVVGLSNGSYVFTYGSYDNWFVDPGSNSEVMSTAKILTSGGLASAPVSVAGVGVGSIASVVNSDGTKGFMTLGVTNTPNYGWEGSSNGERELKLSLNYYSDAGVLLSKTPDIVSGSAYVLSYEAYYYPAAVLYAGKSQGTGLIIKQSPEAVTTDGTDLTYSLEAVLLDQPLRVVTLSTNSPSIAEAAGVATITATLSAVAGADTIVTLGLSGTATGAGTDYTLSAPTITIASGQLTGTATLTAVQDTLDEDNETIIAAIASVTGGGGATGTGSATVTITDDDPAPTVSIAPTSIAEGNAGTTSMVFTVSLSAPSSKAISVDYATADDTTAAGTDYVSTSGTLNFAAGQTIKTISVTVNGDTAVEANENLRINLTNVSNAALGTASAVGTIVNDDANSVPTALSLSKASVAQSGGANAVVGTLGTTDADVGQSHTYTLVAGDGSNDAGNPQFNILGASLRANSAGGLAAGDYKIVVRTDDGSNGTLDRAFTIVVVDDVAPLTDFNTIRLSADTGSSQTDLITNTLLQTISATLTVALIAGDKVFGMVDGVNWIDITSFVTNGQLNWTNVSLLATGGTLRLKVADAAGNESVPRAQTYVVDTTPPTAISGAFPLSADTGASASDGITRIALQDLSGVLDASLAAGELVEVSVNGGATWTAASGIVGSPNWQANNLSLLAGANTLSVRVSDLAGNHATPTTRSYVLDTTAPQLGGARVNGASLVLTYTDTLSLDATNLPAMGAFTVMVGGSPRVVNGVAVDAVARTVTLTLASAVSAGEVVTVSYADPTAGDDANALQDIAGNDGATFAAFAVANDLIVPSDPATPTVPTTLVDGVAILIGIGADGYPLITVPVIVPGRTEDGSTANSKLADIPLVKHADGSSLLTAGIPVGTGLTASGPGNYVSIDTARSLLDSRIPAGATAAEMKAAGQAFLNGLPPGTQVVVQTIKLSAQDINGGPLMIGVGNIGDGHKTLLVIDTSALPAGTVIQLDNVDFAVIVGNARVTGGAGANIVYGDEGQQFIVLGEGDDILHGGGNNDTVGSLRGNDQTFGDGGNDVVYGGTGNDVLNGGAGNDRMNGGFGQDKAVQSGVLADYTVSRDGLTVVLTHKLSGEIDRFLDVEAISFDSGASLIVAYEAGDVAALTAQFVGAQLIELNANRAVAGTTGRDDITPELGMALNIDLGTGTDIVRLAGARADVHIDVEAGQRAELTRLSDGAMLALNKVELLAFANGNVTVLAHNQAEAVIGRAYELLLGRNVDTGGYAFWLAGVESGVGLRDTLAGMMRAPEYAGTSLSNSGFVEALYTNGLGRAVDNGGKAFWVSALDAGVSRAQVLEGIATSKEAITVIGSTIDVSVVS